MTRDEMLRALVATSETLHGLWLEAKRADRTDVAMEIRQAGDIIAVAIGRLITKPDPRAEAS